MDSLESLTLMVVRNLDEARIRFKIFFAIFPDSKCEELLQNLWDLSEEAATEMQVFLASREQVAKASANANPAPIWRPLKTALKKLRSIDRIHGVKYLFEARLRKLTAKIKKEEAQKWRF